MLLPRLLEINAISELLDFKIFWGNMLPDPLGKRGLTAPFLPQLPTSQNQRFTKTPIETSDLAKNMRQQWHTAVFGIIKWR